MQSAYYKFSTKFAGEKNENRSIGLYGQKSAAYFFGPPCIHVDIAATDNIRYAILEIACHVYFVIVLVFFYIFLF